MRLALLALTMLAMTACTHRGRPYYISSSGDDAADGSLEHPWKTLQPTRGLSLKEGDAIYLQGGATFQGTLHLDSPRGGNKAITIASYGEGLATLMAGDSSAIVAYNAENIMIKGLRLIGAGRKQGNVKEGLYLINCSTVTLNNLEIKGFQKAGLMMYGCSSIFTTEIFAHDNGAAGIAVEGPIDKKGSRHIQILGCRADNNPGDPTNLTNHSGNGIVVGHCTDLLIDGCSATNNGWDMPRIGNGPVGIWCYEADSVTIQNCLAYKNKTSPGAADGGGFDLDGGVTHSIIQHCLSYGNQGSGYCIFQYWGASPWHDNIIRDNISENDGTVSDSRAGIYVWNSSDDPNQFYNCQVTNNTIYSAKEAAISYSEKSERKGFIWSRNIFVGGDSLIRGKEGADVFDNNDWWCLHRKGPGMNLNPEFKNPGNTYLTTFPSLGDFESYKLPDNSPLKGLGASF